MPDPVLVVSADVPWPLNSGGRIVTHRVLQALTSIFSVDLVCLRDPGANTDPNGLSGLCRSIEVFDLPFTFRRHPLTQAVRAGTSLLTGRPYRIAKFQSRRLAERIDEIRGGQYVLAHFEQLGVAPYARHVLPTTLTHHNVESDLYRYASERATSRVRRAWSRIEADKLVRIEPLVLKAFDHVFALSEHDRALLRQFGVRGTSVLPVPMSVSERRGTGTVPPNRASLISLGTMSWFGVEDGLRWFHDHVWPRIRAQCREVTWTIVGPDPGPRIRSLTSDPAIKVTGYVDDVTPLVDGARVLVVPLLFGGGVRIKLLESMANGPPFVATSPGAGGLADADGQGGYVRDTPAEFADAVVTLLRDAEAWSQLREAGRAYVSARHTPQAMQRAILDGIDSAMRHFHDGRAP